MDNKDRTFDVSLNFSVLSVEAFSRNLKVYAGLLFLTDYKKVDRYYLFTLLISSLLAKLLYAIHNSKNPPLPLDSVFRLLENIETTMLKVELLGEPFERFFMFHVIRTETDLSCEMSLNRINSMSDEEFEDDRIRHAFIGLIICYRCVTANLIDFTDTDNFEFFRRLHIGLLSLADVDFRNISESRMNNCCLTVAEKVCSVD